MLKHESITDEILASFYAFYNALGYGFLEKVYQNALFLELQHRGLKIEAQKKIAVYFRDRQVGEYYADIIVENKVIIELKAEVTLHPAHDKQLRNYLKATNIEVGLLLNFGEKPQFRRNYFENT